MPAPRVVPEAAELMRMIRRGMTTQQIADEVYDKTGVRVTRQAVSAALARAGYDSLRPRYEDLIPWRVKPVHGSHYALRMLRAEARRRAGEELGEMESRRLASWLKQLKMHKVVVHYDRDTDEGFHYIPAQPGEDLIHNPSVAA